MVCSEHNEDSYQCDRPCGKLGYTLYMENQVYKHIHISLHVTACRLRNTTAHYCLFAFT